MTDDGSVAVRGRVGALSSPLNKRVFRLRAVADVVLVGAGTVRAERDVAGDHDIDLGGALARLRERGHEVMTCEGGPTLLRDLLADGLPDELCLTVAPLIGGDPLRLVAHDPGLAQHHLSLAHVLRGGDEFTQCSMDPTRFLVLLSNKNHTYEVASGAEVLAVHFLSDDQGDLAELFGSQTGDDIDKFRGIAHTSGPAGTPLLDACPERFIGRVRGRVALADHTGFLLEPVDDGSGADARSDIGAFAQLGFQEVKDLDPGHEP